jgi:3-hydroxyisobutyrate dehydrogenase
MPTTVGFIGIGLMGSRMSANLLKAGFPVVAYDLVPEALAQATAKGARAAASAAAVAREAPMVITMLPNAPHVEAAVLGPGGIVEGTAPGATTVIDMSTIAPSAARRIAGGLAARGVRFLDAPVSGGTVGAEDATLTIMVGGDEKTLDACRPVLAAMGKKIVHMGGHGMGQLTKLANNLVAGINMIALAEGLQLGIRGGLDPDLLREVIAASSGDSWVLQKQGARILDGKFEPGFMLQLMLKDVGLALDTARELGTSTWAGAIAHELYKAGQAAGLGREDFSAVYKLYDPRG